MKSISKWIGGICELTNALPFALLPIFGPFIWAYWLFAGKHMLELLLLGLFWLLSLTIIIIEYRRGKNFTFPSDSFWLGWWSWLTYLPHTSPDPMARKP